MVSAKVDTSKFVNEFKKYQKNNLMTGGTVFIINSDELSVFCNDLEIDLYEDVIIQFNKIFITYFLYRCQCKKFAEVTLEEFSRGMQSFKVSTVKDLKSKILYTKEELLDVFSKDFSLFWEFLFNYNIDKKKSLLDFEICKLYIDKLLSDHFPLCKSFIDFLEKDKKNLGLKRDEWRCYLDLCKTLGSEFPKGYTIEEAWPILFDEFYEIYMKNNN